MAGAVSLAAITAYDLSLFLHITAVVVGLGSTFAMSITFPVAMKLDQRHFPYVHRLHLAISRFLATPALVVVLATGLYQTFDGDWSLGEFWISASFAIVIALGALLGAYFVPAERRLGQLAERELAAAGSGEATLSDDYQRQARNTGVAGGVAGLLVVVAIFLMVTKPGA